MRLNCFAIVVLALAPALVSSQILHAQVSSPEPSKALSSAMLQQCIELERELAKEALAEDDEDKIERLLAAYTAKIDAVVKGKEARFSQDDSQWLTVQRIRVYGYSRGSLLFDVLVAFKKPFENQTDALPVKVEMFDKGKLYFGDLEYDVNGCSVRWGGQFRSGTNGVLRFEVPLADAADLVSLFVRAIM